MGATSKPSGGSDLAMDSTNSASPKPATSFAPRMLTAFELSSMQAEAREIHREFPELYKKVLAKRAAKR